MSDLFEKYLEAKGRGDRWAEVSYLGQWVLSLGHASIVDRAGLEEAAIAAGHARLAFDPAG